jgi:hypothetical protein
MRARRNRNGGEAIAEGRFNGLDYMGWAEQTTNIRFGEMRGGASVVWVMHSSGMILQKR